MLKLKTILSLSVILVIGGSVSAYADDHAETPPTAFETSDTDQNGFLNRGEFIAYTEAKAAEGDAIYLDLVATADYDLAYAERDLNADGMLDRGELGETQDGSSDEMQEVPVESYGSGTEKQNLTEE